MKPLRWFKKLIKGLRFPLIANVFGISRTDEQGALLQSRVDDKLQIVHTPSERFPNRVLVYSIELNRILGYIDRSIAKDLIFVLGENFCVDGEIAELYEGTIVGCAVLIYETTSFMKDDIKDTVVKYFKEYYYNELVKEDVMNIQLISPVKERGDSCVFNLNQAIQELINPESPNKQEIKVTLSEDKYYYLRENDKIICVANNYDMPTIDGQTVDIFNGWTGKIVSIDLNNRKAIVYFPLIDATVLFPTLVDLEKNVMLGYAITCHKMQGASAKVIIGAIDFSTPPKMLTKELLYTLITRAEKLCVLVGQNKAVINAIKNSGVEEKKTFLKEMLDGDYVSEKNIKNKNIDRYIK